MWLPPPGDLPSRPFGVRPSRRTALCCLPCTAGRVRHRPGRAADGRGGPGPVRPAADRCRRQRAHAAAGHRLVGDRREKQDSGGARQGWTCPAQAYLTCGAAGAVAGSGLWRISSCSIGNVQTWDLIAPLATRAAPHCHIAPPLSPPSPPARQVLLQAGRPSAAGGVPGQAGTRARGAGARARPSPGAAAGHARQLHAGAGHVRHAAVGERGGLKGGPGAGWETGEKGW